jgi:hypothetical protein
MAIHMSPFFVLNLFRAKHAEQILVAGGPISHMHLRCDRALWTSMPSYDGLPDGLLRSIGSLAKKSSPVDASLDFISELHHGANHDVLQNHFFVWQHPAFLVCFLLRNSICGFSVMEPFYGQLSQMGRTETTESFKLLSTLRDLNL